MFCSVLFKNTCKKQLRKEKVLDEREFELVNILGADLGSNQRAISRRMNLSLGMINMLIRRLISKGYVRMSEDKQCYGQ